MQGLLAWARKVLGTATFFAGRLAGCGGRIRIYLNWNLGDEVMAIPLFLALKEKYPDARVTVSARYPELFANNPCVDTVYPKAASRFDLVLDIRGEQRPTPRLDYWERLLDVTVKDRRPRLYFSAQEERDIEAARRNAKNRPCVAISTWTPWSCKRWPPDHFRALANWLSRKRQGVTFLELGRSCPWLGIGANWIDRTTIREAAVLLASCDLFIGNDSGLMHLAAAAGIPTIGLFGPIDPITLVDGNSLVHPVYSKVECRGCWTQQRMQKPDQCPLGAPVCMEAIEPIVVGEMVLEVLSQKCRREREVSL